MKKDDGRLHALKIRLEESPMPPRNGLSLHDLFPLHYFIIFIQSCVHHACMIVRTFIFILQSFQSQFSYKKRG